MYENKRILAIIPARGGSKGIPRKNIRFLHNKPLIAYVLETAKKSKFIDKVVVTTDDEEIEEIAKIFGADEIVKRPKELAKDRVTLDPVIFHAYQEIKKKYKEEYTLIITLQATSPLLKAKSIDEAIKKYCTTKANTVISVKPVRHLFWIKKGEKYQPFYKKRKNRQELEPVLFETGGFLITNAKLINPQSRIFEPIEVFELSEQEAIDIDNYSDWILAESLLKRLKIFIRVDGNKLIGMGHVYRMISLYNKLIGHDIMFFLHRESDLGIKKLQENNLPFVVIENEEDFLQSVEKERPNIILLDILDTEAEYIKRLKSYNVFVVSFEDLGTGIQYADLVFNALYHPSTSKSKHIFSGYEYVCLRDEFLLFPKKMGITRDVKEILITFGGIDQQNLTITTLKAIEELALKEVHITIIAGLGYQHRNQLEEYVKYLNNAGYNIDLLFNVKFIARYIHSADIAITSNGRTVFEIASFGVPCIAIAQNQRETTHTFSGSTEGILYLGLADKDIQSKIKSSLNRLIKDYELRKRMNQILLRFDFRNGINKIINQILTTYYENYLNNHGKII